MNALQQSKMLENLSDQQVMQARATVPDYLIAAEVIRRKKLRESMGPKQQGTGRTVADDLFGVPSPMQMPQQPPQQQQQQQNQEMPQSPQQAMMSMGGLVQRLNGGGMVRYAGGGGPLSRVADAIRQMPMLGAIASQNSDTRPAMTRAELEAQSGPAPTLADAIAQAQGLAGPDRMASILAAVQAQKTNPVVDKPSIWQSLMQMGGTMMASRNPLPLGGLGEGIQTGLANYGQSRDQYRADQIRMQEAARKNLVDQAQLAEAMTRRDQSIAGLGSDIYRTNVAKYDTTSTGLQNARLASQAQSHQDKLRQMEIDANAPYRQSQIMANQARAKEDEAQGQAIADEIALKNQMGLKPYMQFKASLSHPPREMPFGEFLARMRYQALLKEMTPEEAALATSSGSAGKGDQVRLAMKAAGEEARRFAVDISHRDERIANMNAEQFEAYVDRLKWKYALDSGITPELAAKHGIPFGGKINTTGTPEPVTGSFTIRDKAGKSKKVVIYGIDNASTQD